MDKADEFLALAQQCQRMADEAHDPVDKMAWTRLADYWMRKTANRIACEMRDGATQPKDAGPRQR